MFPIDEEIQRVFELDEGIEALEELVDCWEIKDELVDPALAMAVNGYMFGFGGSDVLEMSSDVLT